jgi:hypothetical protein
MKRWWLGILTFALVGAAGYLTKDFNPANPEIWTDGVRAAISGGSGTFVMRNERRRKAATQANLDRLLGGSTPIQGSLDAQLGGDTIPEQRVPTAAEVAAADKKCRDRMREIGIIPNGVCADVGDVVDNLATGKYRFNKPDFAILGEPFPLRLTMQTAEAEPVTFDGLPGTVVERPGKLAQDVQATLSDDDFEITPSGPQVRTFTRSEPVEWDWKLKPKSAGMKTLTIEVVANIQVGSDKHPVQLKTLHEPIVIQVTMFQRLKAYVADASGMVVAAAAIATPLAVLIGFIPKVRKFFNDELLARFRRRRARRT